MIMSEKVKLGLFVFVSTLLGNYLTRIMGISNDYLKSIPFSIVFMFISYMIYHTLNKKMKSS